MAYAQGSSCGPRCNEYQTLHVNLGAGIGNSAQSAGERGAAPIGQAPIYCRRLTPTATARARRPRKAGRNPYHGKTGLTRHYKPATGVLPDGVAIVRFDYMGVHIPAALVGLTHGHRAKSCWGRIPPNGGKLNITATNTKVDLSEI